MKQIKQWKYEDFHFPDKGDALAFWKAQQILAKQDPDLYKYSKYLTYNIEFGDSKSIDTNKQHIEQHIEQQIKI
jgi:hypothetical protein